MTRPLPPWRPDRYALRENPEPGVIAAIANPDQSERPFRYTLRENPEGTDTRICLVTDRRGETYRCPREVAEERLAKALQGLNDRFQVTDSRKTLYITDALRLRPTIAEVDTAKAGWDYHYYALSFNPERFPREPKSYDKDEALDHLRCLKEALNGRVSTPWANAWAANYLKGHPYPHSALPPAETEATPPPETPAKPSPRVSGALLRTLRHFSDREPHRFLTTARTPLRLNDRSEPIPDIMLLQPQADSYRTARPAPGHVLLIVEIADSGWNEALEAQARRYAQANITQFLVLNLAEDCIENLAWPGPRGFDRRTNVSPPFRPQPGTGMARRNPDRVEPRYPGALHGGNEILAEQNGKSRPGQELRRPAGDRPRRRDADPRHPGADRQRTGKPPAPPG